MANPLTSFLSERYPEVRPLEFYREVFPEGSLAKATDGNEGVNPHSYEKGTYAGILVRLWKDFKGEQHAERHFVMDELANIGHTLIADTAGFGDQPVTDLLSPVSYAGRSPRLDMAHELFALAFDLDYIQVEKRDGVAFPVGLSELLYQINTLGRCPMPTFIVSSGTGLHLYYLLDKPLRMWPNVIERLSLFRHHMVDLMWNQYVTRGSDKPQYESVVQAFRMVGSLSRDGDQIVRAFRTGARWSIGDLNGFVPDDCRITKDMIEPKVTLEEARELWPEWDPEWRKKAMADPGPLSRWKVKRDLFDWWCRRVEDGKTLSEAFEGNRYWCIFVAACLAAKCPDVTYDDLERWAYGVQPRLDRLTENPANHFTPEDVSDALKAYGSPLSVKLRRDKIAEKTQLDMPVNKRNGRKQAVHLMGARAIQEINDKANGTNWRAGNGRKPKRDLIRQYALEHPGMSNRAIAEALGVSRNTVNKWLKPGWSVDYELRDKDTDGLPLGVWYEDGHLCAVGDDLLGMLYEETKRRKGGGE